ncbi:MULTISPECIES: hypothetical protein [Fibrobacter]|nr:MULTISPECIES: hypothetical protein [Fibrobacter]MDD7299903.1 hypothetical protein [Fibrobacter intestinalis]
MREKIKKKDKRTFPATWIADKNGKKRGETAQSKALAVLKSPY